MWFKTQKNSTTHNRNHSKENLNSKIRSLYGEATWNHYGSFCRLLKKREVQKSHLKFLQTCRDNDLVPKTFRIYCNTQCSEQKWILHKAEKALIRNLIQDTIKIINQCDEKLFKLHFTLLKSTTKDWDLLNGLAHNKASIEREKYSQRQKDKISRMLPRKTSAKTLNPQDKGVVNISKETLKNSEIAVLAKGLNFSITPKQVPKEDIVMNVEKAISHLPDLEQNSVRVKVAELLKPLPAKTKNNLTGDELVALKELKKKDLAFTKADKGNTVVVMDNQQYEEKMHELLQDKAYNKLKTDPTDKIIRKLKEKAELASIPGYIIPTVAQTPRIYGLPKIHKANMPMRPIIAANGGPAHKMAAILNNRIKDLVGKTEHSIKNSTDFISKIKHLKLDQTDILVSFDVESLFTRVPVKQACQIIENKLLERGLPTMDVVYTVQAIETVLDTTYFQFRGEYYEQTEGAAMGSPLSPTIANIFMEYFEQEALRTARLKPKLWFRYVDDTFSVWPHGIEKLPDFIEHLNSITPGIKFTYEIEENGKLPFLDVNVHRNKNGGISTSVYRKSTCSDLYLKSDSCNPRNQKESVLRTLVLRALTHSSNKRYLKLELEHLNTVAEVNGYQKEDVARHLKWARKILNRPKLTEFGPKARKAVIPFHPAVAYQVGDILRKQGIEVAFKPPAKLKTVLPKTKDNIPNSLMPGVYAVPCECGAQYIGETKRSINTRLKEHQKCFEKGQWEQSAIALHHSETKHKILWEDTKIVAQCNNKFDLRFKEALAINSIKNINLDKGKYIPKIWLETIKNSTSQWKNLQKPATKELIRKIPKNSGKGKQELVQVQQRFSERIKSKRQNEPTGQS